MQPRLTEWRDLGGKQKRDESNKEGMNDWTYLCLNLTSICTGSVSLTTFCGLFGPYFLFFKAD